MTGQAALRRVLARHGAVSLVALLVAACATTPRDEAPRAAKTYAFVVLGEEGRPTARVITPEATCPSIQIDGRTEPMDVRARPATIPLRATRSDAAAS